MLSGIITCELLTLIDSPTVSIIQLMENLSTLSQLYLKEEKELNQKSTHLVTKSDIDFTFKKFNRSGNIMFIILVIMILGLYAAIFLKK